MATEEHKCLAQIIKTTHKKLRELTKEKGADVAWKEHLKNRTELDNYSQAMHRLANIWEVNSEKDEEKLAKSRIKWITENCTEYFLTGNLYRIKREREIRLMDSYGLNKPDTECLYLNEVPKRIRLLDAGSCYNPFGKIPGFDVTAFDLCPATRSVYVGDLLQILVSPEVTAVTLENRTIKALPADHFDCVVFSLFLEYIPTSDQRVACVRKAYELLKPEGILIVVTPDSEHVGRNAPLMKNWHYTFSKIGFLRVKFEKLPHITCMMFRKSIDIKIPLKFSEEHFKNQNVEFGIEIPQDKL